MSTVLPPPDEPLLLVLLLPVLLLVLLQPTAARAIAAKAAIAVVRLIVFLSLIEVFPLPQRIGRPGGGFRSGGSRGMHGSAQSAGVAGPAWGVDSGQDLVPGERLRAHLGRRAATSVPSQAVRRRCAGLRTTPS
jgi:hypothetical protein